MCPDSVVWDADVSPFASSFLQGGAGGGGVGFMLVRCADDLAHVWDDGDWI